MWLGMASLSLLQVRRPHESSVSLRGLWVWLHSCVGHTVGCVLDYFLLVVTEYQDEAFVKTGGLAHASRGCKSKEELLATGEGLPVILQQNGRHHLVRERVCILWGLLFL